MDKVREFRECAVECRKSAARAPMAELRAHYEELASIWDKLADERVAFFVAQGEAPAVDKAPNDNDAELLLPKCGACD